MLSFHVKFVQTGRTDRQTTVKQYAPDLSIQGAKKKKKDCGKRRKCWLPAFSPFPTMFSKGFLHRCVKSHNYVVTG